MNQCARLRKAISSMNSLTFFNNKGGVGKTTLCCNVSSYLSIYRRMNVLLIDCDPQCNSTRLILGDDRCEDLYYGGNAGFTANTLLTVLKPIIDGDSSINTSIKPIDAKQNRFDIDILPGHPELAMLEDALSDAWLKVAAGNIEGLRRTHWATYLLRSLPQYDLLVFDVGPSLGALNRSVLIGTNTFITPMGPDIFSIVGVRNIGQWLQKWLDVYTLGITHAESQRGDAIQQYQIPNTIPVSQGFAGYTVQQYITKSKGGVRRPTRAYDDIIQLIPGEIENSLMRFRAPHLTPDSAALGDVPHLYSIVPLAQSNNAPIHGLESSDGLVGAQSSQAESYSRIVGAVADKLLANIKGGA
jgi:cellulose biosynthesis protein BcsQ